LPGERTRISITDVSSKMKRSPDVVSVVHAGSDDLRADMGLLAFLTVMCT
jgi:hypothetical protein